MLALTPSGMKGCSLDGVLTAATRLCNRCAELSVG
jgi:hypothetical protein